MTSPVSVKRQNRTVADVISVYHLALIDRHKQSIQTLVAFKATDFDVAVFTFKCVFFI